MFKLLHSWRYYSFGREQYRESMNKIFNNNLNSLRQANTVVAVFAACFSLFLLLIEQDFVKAGICLATAFIAFLLALYTNYKLQTALVKNRFIYVFTSFYYINIMAFGLYLYLATPDKLYLCFLICALLFFAKSPLFNLYLTLCAMAVFMIAAVVFKTAESWVYDMVETFVAGIISLFFNWHITKLRLGLELSANMLEDERNKYLDQSTTDELTQLNNRRAFMQTFKRFQSSYRTSDDWLCICISDIDFFKNYNDHYGHPQGDECLRSVGAAFKKLSEIMGVYTARVGGEEFAILWFEKEASHVDTVVSTMFNLIEEMKIPHEKSKIGEYLTMSMGVYVERCGAPNDVQTLYDLADKALYTAKGGGRNCAIIYGNGIDEYRIAP